MSVVVGFMGMAFLGAGRGRGGVLWVWGVFGVAGGGCGAVLGVVDGSSTGMLLMSEYYLCLMSWVDFLLMGC